MSRIQRHLDFPERWQRKRPVRIWGSLDTKDRIRSFKTREAAEAAGGTLLSLWYDGCVRADGRRVLRGYVAQWGVA